MFYITAAPSFGWFTGEDGRHTASCRGVSVHTTTPSNEMEDVNRWVYICKLKIDKLESTYTIFRKLFLHVLYELAGVVSFKFATSFKFIKILLDIT